MSKHHVVVLKIIAGQLTVTAAASEYGLSRQYLHVLLARYRDEGLDGLQPRSCAPLTSPQTTTNEYTLTALHIQQKNGAPNHPQTQGKIERFHQALKRWLAARPRAHTITELQQQLDTFRAHDNDRRPHRALDGKTPSQAYTATPKPRSTDALERRGVGGFLSGSVVVGALALGPPCP